jgi:hypothetical protein
MSTTAEHETASLKDRVVAYIESTDYVSYAELASHFPEFKDGEFAISLRQNLILWVNMTQEAAQVVEELRAEKRIVVNPSSLLVYLCDGMSLNMPIAKRVRDYKKPHWAPTTLRPAAKVSK